MLMFLGISCLLFFVADVSCSKLERTDDSKISDDNDYLDDVIAKTIEENRHNLEPYRVDNVTFTFEHKVLLVTFKREVSLEDLVVSGLTTVHREGDCVRKNKDGISKLSASLAMGILEFDSKASVKMMKLGPTFKLHGDIGYVMMHLEVTQDKNAEKPPKVVKLEIYDQKGTDIKVSNLGPLNKLAEIILKAAGKVMKGKINKKIEEKLKEVLDKKFKETKIPYDF